jgi:hypothetical protein
VSVAVTSPGGFGLGAYVGPHRWWGEYASPWLWEVLRGTDGLISLGGFNNRACVSVFGEERGVVNVGGVILRQRGEGVGEDAVDVLLEAVKRHSEAVRKRLVHISGRGLGDTFEAELRHKCFGTVACRHGWRMSDLLRSP